jgi:hypothetical protein
LENSFLDVPILESKIEKSDLESEKSNLKNVKSYSENVNITFEKYKNQIPKMLILNSNDMKSNPKNANIESSITNWFNINYFL